MTGFPFWPWTRYFFLRLFLRSISITRKIQCASSSSEEKLLVLELIFYQMSSSLNCLVKKSTDLIHFHGSYPFSYHMIRISFTSFFSQISKNSNHILKFSVSNLLKCYFNKFLKRWISILMTYHRLHPLLSNGIAILVRCSHGMGSEPENKPRQEIQEGVESRCNNRQWSALKRSINFCSKKHKISYVGCINGHPLIHFKLLQFILQEGKKKHKKSSQIVVLVFNNYALFGSPKSQLEFEERWWTSVRRPGKQPIELMVSISLYASRSLSCFL